MKAGTPLTIRRMCALTRVSRAGFYRRGVSARPASVQLRDQVQRVALEWPTYGSRRITAELRRGGVSVNRKRVRWRPAPGLVHHSDQGVQYASHDYVTLLEAYQVRISMSRRGNPWDNATCESFMKTLKCEEVYRSEYRNLTEARARIGEFLEEIYNQKRLHSSLGYCPPAEFERLQSSPPMRVVVMQEAV